MQFPAGPEGGNGEGRAGIMGDIVNLNDRRKKKAREEKEAKASGNRAKFGRTKGEKQRDEKERSTNVRTLDAARRERDEDGETD